MIHPNLGCVCGKSFGRRDNLHLHIRRFHGGDYENFIVGFEKKPGSQGRKCPSCGVISESLKKLCQHVEELHDTQMNFISLAFENHDEFSSWLLDIEKKSISHYVQGGKKNLLVCHRSGYYTEKLQAVKRKRNEKQFGSTKIDAICTAHVQIVKDTPERVEVIYQSMHFGHEMEPGTLNLTKEEKDHFAAKRMQGISRKRILRDARRNGIQEKVSDRASDSEDTDDAVESFRARSRAELLTNKDLINIEIQYGINSSADRVRCHASDSVSFGSWVEEERKKGMSKEVGRKMEIRRAAAKPSHEPLDLIDEAEAEANVYEKVLKNQDLIGAKLGSGHRPNSEHLKAIVDAQKTILRLLVMGENGDPSSLVMTEAAKKEPANKLATSQSRLYSIKKKRNNTAKYTKAKPVTEAAVIQRS